MINRLLIVASVILTGTLVAACSLPLEKRLVTAPESAEPLAPPQAAKKGSVQAVRIQRYARLILPKSLGYAGSESLVVAWTIGPPCAGTSASAGKFSDLKVVESNDSVVITLSLSNADVNRELGPSEASCSIGVPWQTQIVALGAPLGSRQVIDGSCSTACAIPEMDEAQRRSIQRRLRVAPSPA